MKKKKNYITAKSINMYLLLFRIQKSNSVKNILIFHLNLMFYFYTDKKKHIRQSIVKVVISVVYLVMKIVFNVENTLDFCHDVCMTIAINCVGH